MLLKTLEAVLVHDAVINFSPGLFQGPVLAGPDSLFQLTAVLLDGSPYLFRIGRMPRQPFGESLDPGLDEAAA